ncbi:hypothetical protein PYK79_12420 [Streptomyces sp. ID05-04B]|nr:MULTISPECIES: hypothetical protein [unclassified Streptomyces]MDX5564000.1 hypothetical protein [Streptomyces sp. ID05-04B]
MLGTQGFGKVCGALPAGSLSGRPRGFRAALLTRFDLALEEPDRIGTGE